MPLLCSFSIKPQRRSSSSSSIVRGMGCLLTPPPVKSINASVTCDKLIQRRREGETNG